MGTTSSPKYNVGEVVLLRSKIRPDLNGEYKVIQVVEMGEEYPCRHRGGDYRVKRADVNGRGPAYRLSDVFPISRANAGAVEVEGCWAESALRKKHIPGELSFTELMQSVTNKENV